MSKAFVIKNKEGKYPDDTQFQPFFTTKDICKTTLYKNFEEAQKARRSEFYKVVEITIAEGGLENELAEKDKEIEKLHKALDSQKRHIDIIEQPFRGRATKRTGDVYKDFVLEIRKQFCDEIREKLGMNQYNTCENTVFDVHYDELKEILDQIEQAEGGMK